MRKTLEIGGFVAAAVLIVFGVVAIVMGVNGRQTVNNSLSHEYIVAGSDMTPSAIKAEAQKAGIASAVKQWPTMDIAGKTIDTGAEAQAMAQYMHIHALEATGGFTYAQMGIYQAKPGTPKSQLMVGGGTDNAQFAAIDPTTKLPVQNGARQVWISETALTSALNMSQLASQVSLFGIVVGIALLLSGFGFAILARRRRAPQSGDRPLLREEAEAREDSRGAGGIAARLHRRDSEGRRRAALARGPRGPGYSASRRPRSRAYATRSARVCSRSFCMMCARCVSAVRTEM